MLRSRYARTFGLNIPTQTKVPALPFGSQLRKDAPVIIMDEDKESYIHEAISELCWDKTLLVIAHRLNTIRHADKILVISGGTIAQQGSHDELMAQAGIYRDFVTARESSRGWSRRKAAG